MGDKQIPEQDKPQEHQDPISDPKLSDEPGHDWSAEGGATEEGAATSSEQQ
ncbi:hypothetical protein [Glutamicibacter uratoxydans]|uniref:hypothetical protein n=1 Tax=Glutamicibacter uratoxydans TaxID=43667 RepID=UPI003D6DDDC2